jgi:AcrR family transcriptional regulator
MSSDTVAPTAPAHRPGVVGPAASRRDRARARTLAEIKAAARAELVAHGPGGIQLRAVARQVGLTAPALYRYYPGLDELVQDLTADLMWELVGRMEAARDAEPTGNPFTRMLVVAREFRRWAVSHPPEFGLVFASPPATWGTQERTPCQEAGDQFGNVFATLFLQMWRAAPFSVPEVDHLAPGLEPTLAPYWTWLTHELAPGIPMGAVVRFLEGWVRIYGSVALETFGHLQWSMSDGEPLFEQTLMGLAELVGRPDGYLPPARP